jgi:gluconolactonase
VNTMRFPSRFAFGMWLLALLPLRAADAPSLLAPGAEWEKVAGDLKFGEGPAWHPDGFLIFDDIPANRTLKLDAADRVSVFREGTEAANGLAFDAKGRLLACEGSGPPGGRALVRIEKDGTRTVLADRYQGKRLNSPNDLAVDVRGRIYFTDPRYVHRETMELDREAVYRVDPDGTLTRIVDAVTRPNGIALSGDGRTLYVADNARDAGVATLLAFDLDARGEAGKRRVVYDLGAGQGIDGITLDTDGRIWATAGTGDKAGILVLAPDAARSRTRLVTFLAMPEDPTNCTFGGPRRDILYVTTASSLYRIRTAVRGRDGLPGK